MVKSNSVPQNVHHQLAATDDIDSPEFNEHLAAIQSKLDPKNEYDCGGFASVFFSAIADEWATDSYKTRSETIRKYIADQEIEIEWLKL